MSETKKRSPARPAATGSAGFASVLLLALFGHGEPASGEEPAPPAGAVPAACPTPDELAAGAEAPTRCEPPPAASETEESEESNPSSQADPPPEGAVDPPAPPPAPEPREGGVSTAAFTSGDRRGGDGDRDSSGKQGDRGDAQAQGSGDDRGTGGKPDREKDSSTQGEGNGNWGSLADPITGRGVPAVPVAVTPESPIPSFLLPIYQECGRRYGVPWRILAAINEVETAFGSNLNISSAGAMGWMQFMPTTWAAYGLDADGDGTRDPYDPDDAICAAASYLEASGARQDLRGAIFAYNHADWYVEMVLSIARSYEGVQVVDPLPPTKRLDPDFARMLARTARAEGADWALVLAGLRAGGARGRVPATARRVRDVARAVAGHPKPGRRLRAALGATTGTSPEIRALARCNRAVGLPALVHGLNAVRDPLASRVLDSPRLSIYEGGRQDVKSGRIDPRVLTLLLYLAESHREITVTSLVSGHGYYARPGVPSAHAFGEAVDITAIDGVSLLGNQEPGGMAERALREILALPAELQPAQVISLFELGGPSFAAADHHDHIHVGY